MTDPQWPQGPDPRRSGWQPPPSEPTGDQNTGYPDPAYAGQFSYPSYTPPPGPGTTAQLPPYWTQTQYPLGGDQQMAPPPPEPPRSPRWLWVLAGAAVLLVIGLVVALVIANGSSKQESAVTPLPPMPMPSSSAPTTTQVPPRITTTLPTIPAPPGATTTAPTGQEQSVVYSVTGQGRAISITYVDTGGILNMEFNVVLPWTKEVTLSPPASTAASVTVLNVGNDVTCTVTVDGENVRERTGSGLTICAAAG